jgi:glycine/D-amino acid oxidase-like deaminating enzyme
VAGCSLLHQLTKLGRSDVVLVEKDELTSGSTWHAAGLCPRFIGSYNLMRLLEYSLDPYGAFEAEAGGRRTRVLLVDPNRECAAEPVPPVGLCQVATATPAAGRDVRLLDLCFARRPRAKLHRALHWLRPQVVGLAVRNVDDADAPAPRSLGEMPTPAGAGRISCTAEMRRGPP